MRRMRIRYAVAGKPIHHTLSPFLDVTGILTPEEPRNEP